MNQPLDVALRVRMLYEAGGNARAAVTDMEKVERGARQLAGVRAGDGLGRDLREVSTGAQLAGRELTVVGQTAARFGSISTVSSLSHDLRAASAPAQVLRRELIEVGGAAEKLGRGHGIAELERELASATRRAEDLERRLDGVGRRAGRGYGRHGGGVSAFVNEALSTTGLGYGARLGMGAAAGGGLAAGAGIAATGAAIAAATRHAISFESAMAEVRKAVDDVRPEQFGELERAILRTSQSTGIAKEQMAALVAQAGFAGRPSGDLARFAEFGAKAAGAFGMTPEATGDALAKMGNVFKLTQAGIEDLADGINVLGDSTAAKERQIVDFLYKAGSNGQALKLTALQTAAIGAAAISSGKEADVAATGFNAFAMRLATANRQGADFQKGLRMLGLSSRTVKADLAQNPFEAVLKVLEKLNALPENKKIDASSRLMGAEYGDDLLSYAGQVDEVRKAWGKLQDQSARAGSVERTFKIFDATTERSIARATTNIEAFAAKMGQRFTPAVREAAGWVERLFGGMVKAMELGDRVGAIGEKMAKGVPLAPEERKEIDADPELKERAERRSRELMQRGLPNAEDGDRGALELRTRQGTLQELEARIKRNKARGLDTGDLERQLGTARERFNELYPREGLDQSGSGKRSDLQEGVKASLASYNAELDRGLDRAERRAREAGRQMREDLAIGAKIELAALRYGGDGGARIQSAALGGGGLGGGLSSGGGGSSRGMPGRFGGSIPLPSGGGVGRGHGGGGSRRGGSSEPAEDGPTESIPGTLNPRLAGSRKALMDELDRDPALRRDVLKTVSMENRGSPFKMQTVLESMVNRAKMNGYGSLRQAIHSGFYGPVNRGGLSGALSEKDRRDGEAALKQVREGSNAIGYRTDQGMLTDPGARRYMREPDHSGHRVIGGENYFYMGRKGREWARRQEAEDAGSAGRGLAGGARRPEVLADPNDERRRPEDGFRSTGWRKSAQSLLTRVDMEADGGMYGRKGLLKQDPDQDFWDALSKEGDAEKATRTKAMERARKTGDYRGAFVDEMKRRAARGTIYGHREDEAQIPPGGGRYIDELNGHVNPPGGGMTGEAEDQASRHFAERQRRTSDPAYQPKRELSLDEIRRLSGRAGPTRSPRFMDPSSYSLKPGVAAETMGTGGGGRFGLNGPVPVQNFHGGFDAGEVARRAQLESNRAVRGSQARALHDVGQPV